MELIVYLKEIYSGKRAIYNHITLFSLLGIMVIFLNNLFAGFGSSLYIDLFAVPPTTSFELWFAFFCGFLLLIYLFGYSYEYISSLFKKEDCSLIEFSWIPFKMFFKIFPMFFLWHNYFVLTVIFGSLILITLNNSALLYMFAAFMLCLIPFVYMVLLTFCSRFKYRIKFFYPWLVFQYMDKTLGAVCILFLQILCISIIPAGLIFGIVKCCTYIQNEVYQFALELACLCFGVYFLLIIKYLFSIGLVKIIKEKLLP